MNKNTRSLLISDLVTPVCVTKTILFCGDYNGWRYSKMGEQGCVRGLPDDRMNGFVTVWFPDNKELFYHEDDLQLIEPS